MRSFQTGMKPNDISITYEPNYVLLLNGLTLEEKKYPLLRSIMVLWKITFLLYHMINRLLDVFISFTWWEVVLGIDSLCIMLTYAFVWFKLPDLRCFFKEVVTLLPEKRRRSLAREIRKGIICWLLLLIFDSFATGVVPLCHKSLFAMLKVQIPDLTVPPPLPISVVVYCIFSFSFCVHHFSWLSAVFLLHYIGQRAIGEALSEFSAVFREYSGKRKMPQQLLPFWRKIRRLKAILFFAFGPVWFTIFGFLFVDCVFRLLRETSAVRLTQSISDVAFYWGHLIGLSVTLVLIVYITESWVIFENELIERLSNALIKRLEHLLEDDKAFTCLLYEEINRFPRYNPTIWGIWDIRLVILFKFVGALVPLSVMVAKLFKTLR